MKKTILKILMCTLILLIGIGAVNAIEQNSTDELLSFEQNDEISVIKDNVEVLSAENNTEVIANIDNASEIVCAEDNNEVLAVCGDNADVLSVENNHSEIIAINDNGSDLLSVENVENNSNELISLSNDNNVLSSDIKKEDEKLSATSYSSYYDSNGDYIKVRVETKRFFIAKITIPKKYKKFLNGYKPSKKNKKAWKKYKSYKKITKKKLKKFKKDVFKKLSKLYREHWMIFYKDPKIKIKYSKKNIFINYYCGGDRAYNYNPTTEIGWWQYN